MEVGRADGKRSSRLNARRQRKNPVTGFRNPAAGFWKLAGRTESGAAGKRWVTEVFPQPVPQTGHAKVRALSAFFLSDGEATRLPGRGEQLGCFALPN
ncbi:hypothetical protein GGR07_001271 [Bacteroides pyogenes]|nr:hypothetical protein [Bacteroides pyogenes]